MRLLALAALIGAALMPLPVIAGAKSVRPVVVRVPAPARTLSRIRLPQRQNGQWRAAPVKRPLLGNPLRRRWMA